MYVRVVRFTDVSADRVEAVLARIKESDGPPPGVASSRLQLLSDEEQGTAVVLQYFATADDMAAGARVLQAMDAGCCATRDLGDPSEIAAGIGWVSRCPHHLSH